MRLEGVVGRAFDPVEFIIGDRLSIQNWGRCVGTDEEAFLHAHAAREAGWLGRPVPPVMYAFFLTLPNSILVDELGFTWGRTLAAGIKVEVGRVVGDEEWVRGQTFADVAYEKVGKDGGTRQMLRLRTDFHDDKERLVNRWQTLFIEKSDGPVMVPLIGEELELPPLEFEEPDSPSPTVPVSGRLDSVEIGPFDRLDFARLSVALDDPNLVHLDEAVAATAGFDGVIGSGGYILGAMYEMGRRWAGTTRIRSIEMRQYLPYPQDVELQATGRLDPARPTSAGAAGVVDALVTDRATDTTIATGTITVQL